MSISLAEIHHPDEFINRGLRAMARQAGEIALGGRCGQQQQPLLLGNLQPLTPPDPLDPLVIDDPACLVPQHPRNLAIAVAAILSGQRDDVGGQPILVCKAPRYLALRRAMLAERRTGAALGYVRLTLHMLDASTPACGA